MRKSNRLENDHFKKEMDCYISPNSLFTNIDRQRVLDRMESAKRRKRWWGKPKLLLSFLLLFIVTGTLFGVYTSFQQEQVSAKDIMGLLYPGMSEVEVRSALGEGFVRVENAMESVTTTSYRYDYPATEGYVFEEPMDFFDLEGVKSGQMEMQVMVTFQDYRLVRYSLLYNDDEGGTVIRQVDEKDVSLHQVD